MTGIQTNYQVNNEKCVGIVFTHSMHVRRRSSTKNNAYTFAIGGILQY